MKMWKYLEAYELRDKKIQKCSSKMKILDRGSISMYVNILAPIVDRNLHQTEFKEMYKKYIDQIDKKIDTKEDLEFLLDITLETSSKRSEFEFDVKEIKFKRKLDKLYDIFKEIKNPEIIDAEKSLEDVYKEVEKKINLKF